MHDWALVATDTRTFHGRVTDPAGRLYTRRLPPTSHAALPDMPDRWIDALLEPSPEAQLAKTCVQAFVRDTIGKRKPLALAVADVAPLKDRKRGREGFTVADAIAIRDQLGTQAGRIWWSMCLTGMGPKELWGAWSVEQDRVHIEGTKAFGRVRDVPLVDTPVRPELTRDGFTSALRRLETKVTPYQARKTFARWMEDARIPRTRREIYRGHGKRDIGDVYERYEVAAYLREDAQSMRALLGPQKLAVVR
jgi:integrase